MLRILLTFVIAVAAVAATVLVPCSERESPSAPVEESVEAPPAADSTPGLAAHAEPILAEDAWRRLSHQEQGRAVARLLAHLRRGGKDVHSELREMISSEELTGFLDDFPKGAYEGHAASLLEDFHRIARAGHIQAHLALARRTEDPLVRSAARKNAGLMTLYTDRHREEVAAALLEDADPTLAKAIRRLLADPKREAFEADLAWVARWLWEEPRAVNAELLLALAKADLWWTRIAAVRAMGFLEDEGTGEYLRKLVEERGEKEPWEYAFAALARRGDEDARKELEAYSLRDAECLGAFHDLDPAAAAAAVRWQIFGSDELRAHAALTALRDTTVIGDSGWGILWDPVLFARVEDAALRSPASGLRLARIGSIVPGARTRRLAERAARLMAENHPDPDSDGFQEWDWAPFLEVGAPDSFRRMLADWKESSREGLREAALELLLLLGEGGLPPDAGIRELAIHHGLPDRVEWSDSLSADVGGESWSRFESAVREGRPVDGLVALLAKHPDEPIWNLGLVDDPRIAEHLRRVRDRRDLGLYAWATGELAASGDAEARREQWAAIRAGRYRWVDECDTRALTLGEDLSTIPFFMDELESNCCRFATISGMVEDLFGIDPYELLYHPRATAADALRRWWNEHGGRLVRSRIASGFVQIAD